ncbi:MAG: SDR family oxidoreductase [Tardiphaga sp.]|jgi:NAD(P)-dependent dehydrogenase (short-subunit alcohol dehydrogenase family)|nr:SDR family oxidoreductase [Tardiphaga sp.]
MQEPVARDLGVAIVTGGASGIGLAIAKALVGEGWKVLIADLTRPALDAAQAQIDAIRPGVTRSVVMDVAVEASVIAGLTDCETGFGPVRGLVNSAGIGRDVPFFDTSVELFREILDINLVGTFTVAREAGRLMRAHGGGAIVNIASVSGLRGNIGRSAYGASKGGVVTLTQVMACELAPLQIRVNAIAPGPFETPMVQAMHSEQTRAGWLQVVPQRRYAEPEEIAGAAVFLLDDRKSSFVTGHILNVDGGFAAHGLLPAYPQP